MVASNPAQAATIRDAEIEHTIRSYASPLLTANGLEPSDVTFHIVKDDSVNAFVTGGQNIFLTTGMLMAAAHPGQVIGVLSHELGHITGGHLARLSSAFGQRRKQALIGRVIGVAMGILAKDARVVTATSAKAQDIARKSLHKYTRSQEQAADQAAINTLDHNRMSARGLLEFLELLQNQELLVRSRQDPYLISHPLTSSRIAFVRNHIAGSSFSNTPIPERLNSIHKRLLAKLRGFINPPARTLYLYKPEDQAIGPRYGRAIAFYRNSQFVEAIKLINGLIKELPNDTFFHELKGQILFENGKLTDALRSYERAVTLRPSEPLLRVGLAHVQIELNQPNLINSAIQNLEQALRYDRLMPLTWRLAAIAYGREDRLGLSALMSAEYNTLIGRHSDARGQAKRAMRLLPEKSPNWLRAQEISNSSSPAIGR